MSETNKELVETLKTNNMTAQRIHQDDELVILLKIRPEFDIDAEIESLKNWIKHTILGKNCGDMWILETENLSDKIHQTILELNEKRIEHIKETGHPYFSDIKSFPSEKDPNIIRYGMVCLTCVDEGANKQNEQR